MAVRTYDELNATLKEILGENTDDKTLNFLEDFTDTLNNSDNVSWKEKYDNLDAEWRKKYRERFFNSSSEKDDTEPNDEQSWGFDNLFRKGER